VVIQEEAVVTASDRRRLQEMIESLRDALPVNGEPYRSFLAGLEQRLSGMVTVSQKDVDADVVTMNSQVRVRNESDRQQVLTLVYDRDADAFGETLSVVSPAGAALLGSRVGDEIELQGRRGWQRLRIDEVVFQPEAAGKFDL
jgi:regulator of nucleoside diphosphate kinase